MVSGKIITNELLKIYLTNRLQELERIVQRKADNGQVVETILRWTGSKRALVIILATLKSYPVEYRGSLSIWELSVHIRKSFWFRVK